MKKIKAVTVHYDDDTTRTFVGTGREPMVSRSLETQQGENPEAPHRESKYEVTVLSLSLLLDRRKTN